MSEHVYTPSAWGQAYHNTIVDELLGAGSAGPGKTEVLINDPNPQIYTEHKRCEEASDHPYPLTWGNSVGWALHLRRTVPQLLQTIERTRKIFPFIDPKVKWYGADNLWEFSSGYKWQAGHCKDPDDWENYYSNEYTHVSFDELTQFLETQYDQIRTRVRTADPVLMKMLRTVAMSNPLVQRMSNEKYVIRDPHWVRRRFVDPSPEGRKILKEKIVLGSGEVLWTTRLYLPAKLSDNPNKEFVRQYEIRLRSMKPHIQRALLEGNWYATADSFYGDTWDPQIHVCRPFKIPDNWPRFRTLDWGFKNPGRAYWWALDDENNLYCYRELCFKEKTDAQVAMMIMEIDLAQGMVKQGRSLLTGPADTQLWEERGETAKTKAAVMASKGVYWTKADKLSRKHNAERLVARLRDHSNGKTAPGFVVFNTCREMVRTIPMIQTDPDDIEVPADGGDDHSHDNACYACAYVSRGRVGMPKPALVNEWERPEEKDSVSDKRGRLGYGI
jgi:hypothetical protein